eukprot:scaffold16880_cov97-Skeletonema_dohrnii-CCMP3373.AAC.1
MSKEDGEECDSALSTDIDMILERLAIWTRLVVLPAVSLNGSCQRDHRPLHGAVSKKRVAELCDRDDLLFEQPESSHLGDCPICFFQWFTGAKRIAGANMPVLSGSSTSNTGIDAIVMKELMQMTLLRCDVGARHYGKGDYGRKGVEKDEKMVVYHAEEAAIAGHPTATFIIGRIEWNNGSKERALVSGNAESADSGICEGVSQERGLCRGAPCTPGCRECNEKSAEGYSTKLKLKEHFLPPTSTKSKHPSSQTQMTCVETDFGSYKAPLVVVVVVAVVV